MKRGLVALSLALLAGCTTSPEPAASSEPVESATSSPYGELESIGLAQEAAAIAAIMRAHGFPKVETVRPDFAISLASRGVTAERLRAVEASGEDMSAFFKRRFNGPLRFSDFMAVAENAFLGTVGEPVSGAESNWGGPSAFNVIIDTQLVGDWAGKSVVLVNTPSSEDTPLQSGMECVFFPSQARTDFVNANPIMPWIPKGVPANAMQQSSGHYCTSGGDIFSEQTQLGGEDSVTRREVMSYAQIITTAQPAALPPLYSVASQAGWDIQTKNGNPVGERKERISLTESSMRIDYGCGYVRLEGPIIDGKLKTYGSAHADNSNCDESEKSEWTQFMNTVESGTFYGDRQTMRYDSKEFSFTADRVYQALHVLRPMPPPDIINDTSPITSHRDIRTRLSRSALEQCLLDHPQIGAARYGDMYVEHFHPPHTRIMLLPGAEAYLSDCTDDPYYKAKSADYSLIDLNAAMAAMSEIYRRLGIRGGGGIRVMENRVIFEFIAEDFARFKPELDKLRAAHPSLVITQGQGFIAVNL